MSLLVLASSRPKVRDALKGAAIWLVASAAILAAPLLYLIPFEPFWGIALPATGLAIWLEG